MSAQYILHDDVALITLDNPPVNGLGYSTRLAITNLLDRANQNDAVRAIVLTGHGKAFSGGADIKEFGTDKATLHPHLSHVIGHIENSQKPVIAAIHSVVMGGGLELAMGCHYRIVSPGCSVALPEVKLGLLPGAGGTQRLPRALGVEVALNMIVSGEAIQSDRLMELPGQQLFQKISAQQVTLLEEAIAYAKDVADIRPLPLVRDLSCKHPLGSSFFQFARNTVRTTSKNFPAPLRCIDAVEASTLNKFEDGLSIERNIFNELMQTAESRSLRHFFLASRAASKINS